MNHTLTQIDTPAAPARWSRGLSTGVACCLFASPVLLIAGFVATPTMSSDDAGLLTAIARDPARWYLAALFFLLSYTVLLPATVGVWHLARARGGGGWVDVAGALALVGAAASVGDSRVLFVVGEMATPSADRPAMLALLHRIEASAGAALPAILGVLALLVGTVALAVALPRSGVPVWGCAALAVGMTVHIAAAVFSSGAGLIGSSVLLLIGYGAVAVRLLKTAS